MQMPLLRCSRKKKRSWIFSGNVTTGVTGQRGTPAICGFSRWRENAPEAEPLPGYTQDDLREILADTMGNTQLLLKSKDLVVPIRTGHQDPAGRAKISGPALNRLEKPVLAGILNHCLRIASGEALLRISDGKLSAVHGGDSSDYAVLEMPELFNRTIRYLNDHFQRLPFAGGFYDHSTPPPYGTGR